MRAVLPVLLLLLRLWGLKLVKSALDIYITAGSLNKPQVLHTLLSSMSLDKDLWFLLNHPTIDFRVAWDQTCDVLRPHPIWKDGPAGVLTKFMTPNCLVAYRGVNTEAAFELAKSFDTRPVLDLRSFVGFCPFGHEDGFAEFIFTKAAWGYGPLLPAGQWCRALHWRSFYPDDIWPLFDIECLEAMDHVRRYKIPVFELISDKDTWSLSDDEPDYMNAAFRYIHFSVLEKELMMRPWLTRLNALCGVYRTKLMRLVLNLAQSKQLENPKSPWLNVFLHLLQGNWDGKHLQESFIPLIRSENSINRAFQNRMILYYMALLSHHFDLVHDDISSLLSTFIDLLQDKYSNPVYLSKFLEFATSSGNDFSSIITLTIMNYPRPSFDAAESFEANLWEIFLRQQKNFPRGRDLLLNFSLRDRKAFALKSLRYVSMHRKLGFWVNVPELSRTPRLDNYWARNLLLPDVLSNYNAQSLQSYAIIPSPDQRFKVNFGFGWTSAVSVSGDDFTPVKSKREACLVLEALFQHELLAIDCRGGIHSYSACQHIHGGDNNASRLTNLMVMLFVFGCQVSPSLLPASDNFFVSFNRADRINIDGNWLHFSELKKLVQKPIK